MAAFGRDGYANVRFLKSILPWILGSTVPVVDVASISGTRSMILNTLTASRFCLLVVYRSLGGHAAAKRTCHEDRDDRKEIVEVDRSLCDPVATNIEDKSEREEQYALQQTKGGASRDTCSLVLLV